MADESIQSMNSGEHKVPVREQLANTEIMLSPIDEFVDLARAKKVPLGQVASAGIAFASMPKAFRSVTQTLSAPASGTLMQAFTADGVPLDISMLQKFKDGSGALGSTRLGGTFQQARLVQAEPLTLTTEAAIPYDPAMIAMAIALQQINQKLDSIQKTVGEMFDYMKQHEKSKMRGNLQTLAEILADYQLNWDNPRYMGNAHNQVLEILRDARKDMDFHSDQARKRLADKAPVEMRGKVETRLNDVLDSLKDYQLATYIYSFASFLDPVLSENFKDERLASVAKRIEEASVRYREVYTHVYNELESATTQSLDATFLDGLSTAGKFLGQAVAATPIGGHTHIDEALKDSGRAIKQFNRSKNSHLLMRLHEAKSPDVLPFKESVMSLNALYNQPSRLLTDGKSLYVLPTETD